MRLCCLSHRRPAKAQTSLRIRAVSPEPSLFAHMSMEVDEGSTKNQTSSPTGWLRMCVWRMRLRNTKSTVIPWHGSKSFFLFFRILDYVLIQTEELVRQICTSATWNTSTNRTHDEVIHRKQTTHSNGDTTKFQSWNWKEFYKGQFSAPLYCLYILRKWSTNEGGVIVRNTLRKLTEMSTKD